MRSPDASQENVIPLFGAKSQESEEQKAETSEVESEDIERAFHEIMRQNKANLDRMRRERNSLNKSVLRSYRIKN